jgi:hypothetical protein
MQIQILLCTLKLQRYQIPMQLPHERTVEIVTDWMADLGAHDIGMRIQPREGRYE